MKAGFYQFAPVFGRKDENLEKVLSALKGADANLIVLPEFFATGYQFISKYEVAELSEPIPNGYTTQLLLKLSRQKDIYIVAGLPERDGARFFNSAIFTGPNGFIGVYPKTPGRVFPNMKMSGHMGNRRRTTQSLELVSIDEARGLLLVKGAVPGAKGGDVIVRPAVKA